MDHLGDLHAAPIEALLQPLFEHLIGNSRRQSERGLFHKKDPIAKIHGIEKGGRFTPLRRSEVIAAIVHQHKSTGIDRRLGKTSHHAIGRLTCHRSLIGPLDEGRTRTRRINHQARLQRCSRSTGHRGG